MITADAITDEQIRALRETEKMRADGCRCCMGCGAFAHARHKDEPCTACKPSRERIGLTSLALGLIGTNLIARAAARARCAEILNARSKGARS